MTAGPKPTLQLLRFCVSLISVTLFGGFSFLQVYGVVEVLIYEVSVRILFASYDSQSIVCPCKLFFFFFFLITFIWLQHF